MNNRSLLTTSSLMVLFALFVGVNTLTDRIFGNKLSIDLTEEGLYSLSEGTKKIISELQQPLILRLYMSKDEGSKYPLIKIYGKRVRDILDEYQSASKGLIKVEFYDPKQDTEEQEWAQKYGLTPIPLPTGGQLYFGLVAVNSLGKEETLPMFDIQRQEFLEYDITKLLYSLGRNTKPIIGLISPLNVLASASMDPSQPTADKWVLASQLEKFAKVISLQSDVTSISDEIEQLIIIHPKSLSDKTLYAIDQFLMKGGRIFVAVDSYAAIDAPQQDPQNPMANFAYQRSSNMEKLFKKWGIEFKSDRVVGDMNLAASVTVNPSSPPIRFPAWLLLSNQEDYINSKSIVTSQLENVVLPWPGFFNVTKVDGLNSEVLLQTSNEAGSYLESEMRFLAQNPEELTRKLKPDGKSKVLAVSVTGKFQSAFDTALDNSEHLKTSTTDGVVIAVSDVDFLTDQYSSVSQNLFGTKLVSLINDNLIFLANASESLFGSNALISLRSRGKFARPFTKVQDIELKAQEKWQAEEQSLQEKLNAANQRLAQLESGTDASKGVFSNAMMDEIRKFREQRSQAQSKLRDVRRKLREDKEGLGNFLFYLNAFLVPLLIIISSFFIYGRSAR